MEINTDDTYCYIFKEFDNGTNPEDFCSYAENTCENTCDFTRMSHAKDTIYRQDAIDALAKNMPSLTTPDGCGEFDHDIQVTDEAYVDCMQIIQGLPSAEPERKNGEWTKDCACGICGFKPWYERDIHTLSFCPYCGADMRGENNG